MDIVLTPTMVHVAIVGAVLGCYALRHRFNR
jgi:hypothetical protein